MSGSSCSISSAHLQDQSCLPVLSWDAGTCGACKSATCFCSIWTTVLCLTPASNNIWYVHFLGQGVANAANTLIAMCSFAMVVGLLLWHLSQRLLLASNLQSPWPWYCMWLEPVLGLLVALLSDMSVTATFHQQYHLNMIFNWQRHQCMHSHTCNNNKNCPSASRLMNHFSFARTSQQSIISQTTWISLSHRQMNFTHKLPIVCHLVTK
jgi:hypothetical protein